MLQQRIEYNNPWRRSTRRSKLPLWCTEFLHSTNSRSSSDNPNSFDLFYEAKVDEYGNLFGCCRWRLWLVLLVPDETVIGGTRNSPSWNDPLLIFLLVNTNFLIVQWSSGKYREAFKQETQRDITTVDYKQLSHIDMLGVFECRKSRK